MNRNYFFSTRTEDRVCKVLEHDEKQTDDEAVAEDEVVFRPKGRLRAWFPTASPAINPGSRAGERGDILTKARRFMTKVKELETRIQDLSPEELAAFREWFAKFDADAWDQEFEADAMSGKLDAMAERALRDHTAGRSTKL